MGVTLIDLTHACIFILIELFYHMGIVVDCVNTNATQLQLRRSTTDTPSPHLSHTYVHTTSSHYIYCSLCSQD